MEMKMNGKIAGLGLALLTMTVMSCAHHNHAKKVAEDNQITKEAELASELNRSVVSSVNFAKGQKGLSPEAASEIQKALADARRIGKIKTVEVAVWSDMAYPLKGKALPRKQINLANDRAKTVEKLIDQVEPSSSVKTFNMAKQPNAFQKWVDTRDAHVKQKLASSGITSDFKEGQTNDRASTALLFIEVAQ
jgi:hypothetical protein